MWRNIVSFQWMNRLQCTILLNQNHHSVCSAYTFQCCNITSKCVRQISFLTWNSSRTTYLNHFERIYHPEKTKLRLNTSYSGLCNVTVNDFVPISQEIRLMHILLSTRSIIVSDSVLKQCELSPLNNTTSRSISKKQYQFPELKEEDLEEQNVRGWGKGGQAVNTTSNCVVLKHKPTGLMVKCHAHRVLSQNRKEARERLQLLLDQHINGENSFLEQSKRESSLKKKRNEAKASKKRELKRKFKEMMENKD